MCRFKISGLSIGDRSWTVAGIRPFILEAIDVFGVGRVMFASNFPVDKLHSSFTTLYTAFEGALAAFSPVERHKMFYANAERFYDL
jgi:predicted TIM-barrel fold metal-dependent hydrolase